MLETLTFLLSHISQTFKIKENRIFKQKTREKDISYRDRVRRLPRRKVEYISSWRETGRLVLLFTFSFLTVSHCPHYTWSMVSTSTYEVWVAWSRHYGCLLTNTPAPVCPSLWLTPNSRISRAQTIPVSQSRPGYFPRVPARLLAPLPYIPPEWDLPWRTIMEQSEDGHKSRSQAACADWVPVTWHGYGWCLPRLGPDTTPRKLIF